MMQPLLDVAKEVCSAEQRIRPYIRETPLLASPGFAGLDKSEVFFKCENLQHTGSFKVRGALSKALALSREELDRGVVTASTGNHGAAVAYAMAQRKAEAIIFVPENASATKLGNIRRNGGVIREHGTDSGDTEKYAREFAVREGLTYLPPYNDPQVIGGQGTIGIELISQLDEIDSVVVAIGGGGLISGIAGYLKSVRPQIRIIGCSPSNSQVMVQSVAAGKLLDLPSEPTLSDGTAGGVEDDALTFPVICTQVDDFITVSEDQIRAAMCTFIDTHSMLIEGAAGVAIAAWQQYAAEHRDEKSVVVLCGGNIALNTLRQVVCDAHR